MSALLAVGISHHAAPLALRERVAMTEGRAAQTMRRLTATDGIDEAVIVSTCNRTEFYLVAEDPVKAESNALASLADQARIAPTELATRIYTHADRSAAEHLMQVTAGMDSVILGEAEIQGQVRRAYDLALVEGAAGPVLNRLFQASLTSGGRVRQETRIARGGVSFSSVAVEIAEQTLGSLAARQVMLVGTGETARLVAAVLARRGAATTFIANRHQDRAAKLAAEHGGQALSLEAMRERLADVDLVISATNSPHYVLDPEHLAGAAAQRQGRPLVIVDLAVPRDINPNCQTQSGVTVFDIDDLQSLVERNAGYRSKDLESAREIVATEADRFWRWHESLRVLPTVAALRRRMDSIIHLVLSENDARWESLSRADRRRLKSLAEAIGKRLLDEPIRRMKSGNESEVELYAAVIQELFDLDPVDARPSGTEQTELFAEQTKVASLEAHRHRRHFAPLQATGQD